MYFDFNCSIFWCMRVIVILWNDSVFINIRYPKNEVPWKSWLDLRFPRNSMLKWILKWLPLDRGYFKLYFRKGKSILIISCHTSLLTRNFVFFLFQVIFVLSCIWSCLKRLVFWYYWSIIPRKKVAWKLWLDPRFPCHPK